jgi:hypothetical protein
MITRYSVTRLTPILSNVYQALPLGQLVEMGSDTAEANRGHDTTRKPLRAVKEFQWEVYTRLRRRASEPR